MKFMIKKLILKNEEIEKIIKLIKNLPEPSKRLKRLMGNSQIKRTDQKLLDNIKNNMSRLEAVQKRCNDEWGAEDCIYRFYHQSFKVYRIQDYTDDIVKELKDLMPEQELSSWFSEIYKNGTGKVFNLDHNKDWTTHTRPMLEAYFHAKTFLDVAIKYGKELEKAPDVLPSGWALLLYLYNAR